MKRNIIIALVSSLIMIISCKKNANNCTAADSNVIAPATEVASLKAALSARGIVFQETPSGVLYVIEKPGAGEVPNVCSTISIKYRGNVVGVSAAFDESVNGTQFSLSNLIIGWQKGIPLIKDGGKITLYIPPTLGYGANTTRDQFGNITIPANSNLEFKIELLSTFNP